MLAVNYPLKLANAQCAVSVLGMLHLLPLHLMLPALQQSDHGNAVPMETIKSMGSLDERDQRAGPHRTIQLRVPHCSCSTSCICNPMQGRPALRMTNDLVPETNPVWATAAAAASPQDAPTAVAP